MTETIPSGTVTFLFTDIERSTRLLDELGPDAYGQVLMDQRLILRAAFDEFSGTAIDTQGDSFFASFPRASEAVAAVVQIQQALAEHAWPEDVEVRVRMGLHTGEPWLIEEGYVGMAVHRAARIAHVGHGGQVLLSETTTPLVTGELSEGVTLLDLGRHRLKDMRRPEHIHQLVIEGLPSEFPALTSLELVAPPGVVGAEGEIRAPREVGESPYRGLAAFREDDAAFFFGREAFTEQLVGIIQDQQLAAVIVGPSGSGKSSTVFAGLLPQLREEGGWLILQVRPGREPFQALAGALLPFLEEGLSKTDRLLETQKLAQALRSGDLSLIQVVEPVLEEHAEYKRLLLVIDQFEELYTLVPDIEIRDAFHDELLAAVAAGSQGRNVLFSLLLTLRADFMSQALRHRSFADALQEGSILLGPMNREELKAAIEKPAELQGAAFETGLVDRLLDDVGEEPGNLPLLEFALTLLWDQMEQGWLTHAAYDAIERVEGSLARYADEVYSNLSPEEQGAAHRAFVQLVQPGEGTEDTRRIARRDELVGVDWELIQHLADVRLVVTGLDESGSETVEVVHEALIRGWGQLRVWMDEDRDFRRWQEGLRAALRSWDESTLDDGALLRGGPLSQAQEWLETHSDYIGETEKNFIEASAAFQIQRQQARERRRRMIISGLALGLVVAVVLSVFAFNQRSEAEESAELADQSAATAQAEALARATQQVLAEQEAEARATQQIIAEEEARARATQQAIAETERLRAENETRLALSRNLAVDARNTMASDPQLGLLLAIQAVEQTYSVDQTVLPGVPGALHQGIQANSRHLLTIPVQAGRTPYVSYSPDGTLLTVYEFVSGEDPKSFPDNTRTTVRDAFTGEILLELPEAIVADQWPNSEYVPLVELVDSSTLNLNIWDIYKGSIDFATVLSMPIEIAREEILALAISPDLTKFALSHSSGHTVVWDLNTGRLITDIYRDIFAQNVQPVGGNAPFQTTLTSNVVFTADSNSVITKHCPEPRNGECDTNLYRVWDLENVDEEPGIDWASDGVELFLSPDGKYIGFAWTSRAEVFDFNVPIVLNEDFQTVFDHPDGTDIEALVFSPDSRLLGTAASDRTVRVWDVETSAATDGEVLLLSLPVPDQSYHQLSFGSHGNRLATSSKKGQIDIWDIEESGGTDWLTLPIGPSLDAGRRVSIDLSPGGDRLAVANSTRISQVWDTETGELLFQLPEQDDIVERIAYSPNGDLIATCIHAGPLILWDADTGVEVGRLNDHNDGICSLDFNSDGSSLALGVRKNDGGWYQILGIPEYDGSGELSLDDLSLRMGSSIIQSTNIDFNPNGELIAMTYVGQAQGRFRVWEPRINSFPQRGIPLPGFVYVNVSYSPDGERLAATRPNGSTEIWDALGKDLQLSVQGHVGPVNQAAFNPDGDLLATASADSTTKIWDAQTGTELMTLSGHTGPVTDVVFSPDGKKLYTASTDGTVRVYLMAIEDLLELGESRRTRTLTIEECQIYLNAECPN